MAMPVATAADSAYMTVRDLVEFFGETPHPISRTELQRVLTARQATRVRVGRTDYYDISDAALAHRDWAAERERRRPASIR